jgi:ABC-2 type transport system ATP-binding protein
VVGIDDGEIMTATSTRAAGPPGEVDLGGPAGPSLAISTLGLSKTYGDRQAVDDLDLNVPAGVISGFVGPNGAGKTTTIRMLLGLIRPTTGTGAVLGQDLRRPARYLPRVGAMIERPAFHPSLSGRDNLRLLARAGRLPLTRVGEVLARVGLADRGDGLFRSYSLGMKQRLGIAAALLPQPQLLILDEPTNGLDPAGIVSVRELLRSLHQDGMTVLVSSHLLAEVEQIASHLVLIRHGRLAFQGPVEQLVRARHPELLITPQDPGKLTALADVAAAVGLSAAVVADVLRIELPLAPPGSAGLGSAGQGSAPPGSAGQGSAPLGSFPPAEIAAEVNRRAHDVGIGVSGLEVRRPTLEQAYFDLTGAASGDVR